MANDPSAGAAPRPTPPTTAHKLIGTLNVLFACVMGLCGVCSGAGLLMQVAVAPMSEQVQQNMQECSKRSNNRSGRKGSTS